MIGENEVVSKNVAARLVINNFGLDSLDPLNDMGTDIFGVWTVTVGW